MDHKQIEDMKDILAAQGLHGTWNYDPYMHGLYNGMELMLAIAENRDPQFKKAPEKWLADEPAVQMPTAYTELSNAQLQKQPKKVDR